MKVDHSTLREFLEHFFSGKNPDQAQMEKVVALRRQVELPDKVGRFQEDFEIQNVSESGVTEDLIPIAIDAFYQSFGYRRHDPQDRVSLGYSKDGTYRGIGFLVSYSVIRGYLGVTVMNFSYE